MHAWQPQALVPDEQAARDAQVQRAQRHAAEQPVVSLRDAAPRRAQAA
jgi:hypothetical protein